MAALTVEFPQTVWTVEFGGDEVVVAPVTMAPGAPGGGGGGAVDSVNGQTGTVVLDAGDVGAVPVSRTITAGAGLVGGGDLSADRTLAQATATASIAVSAVDGTATTFHVIVPSPGAAAAAPIPAGWVDGGAGLLPVSFLPAGVVVVRPGQSALGEPFGLYRIPAGGALSGPWESLPLAIGQVIGVGMFGSTVIAGTVTGAGVEAIGPDARIDGVDARIDGVDARIDGVDARIDGVDTRIDNLGADDIAYVGFGLLAKASHQVDQNLNAIEGILDRWKFVSAFATVNVDLSSLLGPSEVVTQPTLDGGVAPIRGSYIWLFGQSTAAENGCYYVGSDVDLGVWVRQNDPNTFDPPGNGYRVTCNASGSSVDGVTFMWIDDDRHKQLRAVYSTADPTFGGASSPSGRWVRLATPSTDLTTPSASGIPATLLDAKGDLIVATAADTAARLAVGSDGQVLTADAASSGGVKWAAGGLGIPTAKLSGATDRDWTIPGVIATAITTWTPSTNRAIFQPIVVTAARNYDLIGVEIVTAAAAGTQGRVAIYSIDDYWQPDTRVWQSATFAIDPASVPAMVTTTGPGVLDAGPYMVIFTMDASPTLRVLNVYPPMDSPVYFGAGGGAFRGMTSITSRPTYVASGFPALAATDSLVWDYVSVGSALTPMAIRFREAA